MKLGLSIRSFNEESLLLSSPVARFKVRTTPWHARGIPPSKENDASGTLAMAIGLPSMLIFS